MSGPEQRAKLLRRFAARTAGQGRRRSFWQARGVCGLARQRPLAGLGEEATQVEAQGKDRRQVSPDEPQLNGRAMNQIAMSFVSTRARNTDPQTSRDAAKAAASTKAQGERIAIRQALVLFAPGMTPREIAASTGIDYIECQRRMSETAGIYRTGERRDGCAVWAAL
jgi:hypothetical protein